MNQQLLLTLGYIVLVFGAMYFLWIGPQNRQRRAQAAMIAALAPGDEVVTTGGLLGNVRDVKEDRVDLQVADGVVVQVVKQAIAVRVTGNPITPEV